MLKPAGDGTLPLIIQDHLLALFLKPNLHTTCSAQPLPILLSSLEFHGRHVLHATETDDASNASENWAAEITTLALAL